MTSMFVLSACLCLVALAPLSTAYSTGPPVSIQGVCTNMVPTGHNGTAQTGPSPFEVITNQACYTDGLQIQVVVRTTSGSDVKIAGLFVQARRVDSATTLGTFAVTDSALSPLTCTGTTANSAVGHNKKEETYYRSMLWTPPVTFKENMNFRATIVHHQDTFWVGVESPLLTYNTSCVAAAQITNTRASGTTLQAAPYCLTMALMSFLMAISA